MIRIAIHSVPRSGSTWLGEFFNSHEHSIYKFQPLFSYTFKGYLDEDSSSDDILDFYEKIGRAKDDFLDQKSHREQGVLPTFDKINPIKCTVYKEVRYHHIIRNLLEKDSDIKIVLLIRNPQAVLSSWFNAPREFRKDLGWDEIEEWRFADKKNKKRSEEFFGFEKWKEFGFLAHELKMLYPNNCYILSYQSLLQNTMNEVEMLFQFCGLTLSHQTKEFISQSKTANHISNYAVYKSKTSDDIWKKYLPDEISNSIIEDLKETSLEQYLV